MAISTRGPFEGIPFVGPSVARRRVLRVLDNLAPRNVLVLAPAGYGKTYLAAQMLPTEAVRQSVWIDCNDHALASDALLARVASALAGLLGEEPAPSFGADVLAQQDGAPSDAQSAIRKLISHSSPEGVHIVLDSLRLEDALPAVEFLSREVARASECRLIVTAREVPEDGYGSLTGFHFIEPDELQFDAEEIRQVIALTGGNEGDEAVDAILDASLGQPALVCVLAKHFVSRGDTGTWHVPANADMTSLLIGLAKTQLTASEMELLYALGVLGSASVADICALGQRAEAGSLRRIAQQIPLVRVDDGRLAVGAVAHMHTVAQDVYTSQRFTAALVFDEQLLFEKALSLLEQRGDFERALVRLAASPRGEHRLADWLERNGDQAAATGARLATKEAIDSLPTARLLEHPKLLVLGARLDADLSLSDQALVKAMAARDLARNSGDLQLETEANLVAATALIDQCRLEEAFECLELAAAQPNGAQSSESRATILSYLLAHSGLMLDAERTSAAGRDISAVLRAGKLETGVAATVLNRVAAVAMMFGDTHRSLTGYADVLDLEPIAVELRATALANRATLFMELGRLDRALEAANEGLTFATRYGLDSHQDACRCAAAAIEYSGSSATGQLEIIEGVLQRFVNSRDRASEDFARMYLAVMHRASRHMAASMIHVDQTIEHSAGKGIEYFRLLAEVELAANHLALGDAEAASRRAVQVRELCATRQAQCHLMRADMVLAEVARREGRIDEARSRLLDHEDYILSEDANWSIAMYIRAFPHLLGLFAAALGPERLPTHMLRMITGHHVEDSLSAARKVLEQPEWQVLAYRMLGEEGADRIAALATTPPCRVRLFGGLEVSVGTHQVMERDWRKRKARLLFAMLVLQQGREVPREQIYDHLWPEMDADRSRNNFYVIWSSIKGALVPDSPKGESCPYVEHTGGVCKAVPEHVFSDVAEFDLLMSTARQSENAGDPVAAVRSYEQIADLYRGELLPGDVYDDWFSSARSHYRQEFCDAMRTGHRLLTEMGDHPGALRMIRRGITADPWREDLYQAALRSQIASGQRSAAIDTYLTCRANLADQLGLDPSTETMRLYEQILAMEEHPGADSCGQ
jgi:DNA-binding SARP family transcriptional activator/tetratricopeptide (TPR) repeat protein